jgi:hypothetical protein
LSFCLCLQIFLGRGWGEEGRGSLEPGVIEE